MVEKTPSDYLLNLEKQFATDNPVLLRAAKLFQDLDQIEHSLGLIRDDETTACKHSWWPIISLIGGGSAAKAKFIGEYLGAQQLFSGIHASNHKFTVLLHSNLANSATLTGAALDVDPRYPFYQISEKIERQQTGEGSRVNAYLELKTIQSERLKGKLFIDAPDVVSSLTAPVVSLLTKHTIENSDLVLVFADAFEQESLLVHELVQHIVKHQDANKFVYLVDQATANLAISNNNAIISLWQRKLSALGINSGQFVVLPDPQSAPDLESNDCFAELDRRLANVEHDRSYRILDALEKGVHELETIVIAEVKQGISQWKERTGIFTGLILASIAILVILAEIQIGIGIFEFLLDPFVGPFIVAGIIVFGLTVHLSIGRVQAKFVAYKLDIRQKELHLMENLAGMFDKNLTFSRMVMPIFEPAGWNKKTRSRLSQLAEKAKGLVQALNDYFSHGHELLPKELELSNPKNSP
jgi:hypothetical protein